MSIPSLRIYADGGPPATGDSLSSLEQTCDVVSQLRAFVGVTGSQVYARGQTAIADGYQGVYYWNGASTATDDGLNVVRPSGVSVGAWLRMPAPLFALTNLSSGRAIATNTLAARTLANHFGSALELRDFGAIGDGASHPLSAVASWNGASSVGWTLTQWQVIFPQATSLSNELDRLAIQSWFAKVIATGIAGHAQGGTYVCDVPVVFDMAAAPTVGFKLYGDGRQRTVFASTVTSGGTAPFSLICSGGTAGSPISATYADIFDIGFSTPGYAGPTFDLGKYDGSDYLNAVRLDIWLSNPSDSAAVRCMRVNNLYSQSVIRYNGSIGGSAAVAGVGLEVRQANCCVFLWGGSSQAAGGAIVGTAVGVYVTSGSIAGCTFAVPDDEIFATCVQIDSSSAINNVFLGGQYAYRDQAVLATAGTGNVFYNPNPAPTPGGSTAPFFAGGANNVGVSRIDASTISKLDILAPTSGATVTAGIARSLHITSGALAALTIDLPGYCGDGHIWTASFENAVAVMTWGVGRTGDTIFSAPAAVTAGQGVTFQYYASGAQWFRIT